MAKLRVMSGREVQAILEAHGFAMVRQRGSHMIMQQRLPGTTVTVPIPNHRVVRIGTLSSIIRQSRLPRELFETA